MPTYDFRCPDGHEFEHFFASIGRSKAVMPCPTCGREAQRLISGGAGFAFKGSGFYITDYGKDGKKSERERAAKKESKPEGGEGSRDSGPAAAGGESKTTPAESKPAKKPDSSE
jgi:putative FmdB family regulatory protein